MDLFHQKKIRQLDRRGASDRKTSPHLFLYMTSGAGKSEINNSTIIKQHAEKQLQE